MECGSVLGGSDRLYVWNSCFSFTQFLMFGIIFSFRDLIFDYCICFSSEIDVLFIPKHVCYSFLQI